MIKIVELTKDNEEKYLDQIVELEQISLEAMKKEGREGQLFDTGREGISEYVHSNENSVIVATDENDKVEAATYVTQGQSPFTYNDITKYFKYGEKYKQYVKSQYLSDRDYKKDLRNIYIIKIKAFEYAKRRILRQSGRSTENSLYGYLQQELEQNEYHEKSELRENLNRYMSEYIIQNYGKEIAKKYDFIYTTAGVSPNDIPQTEEELWKSIEEISSIAVENRNNKIVAIGEIGLDYYWNTENKDLQKQAFIKQIELANKLELPIVIHSRDAFIDTIDIIKNHKVNKTGVFHCCQQNQELVKQALELGFFISLAGVITFKNSKNAPEIIDMIPIDRMLIETDSPYLAPEPVRGTRNDSRNVKYTAQKIAELKGLTLEEVAKATYRNAEELYNIEE